MMQELWARIRDERYKAGLTQAELGSRIGVSGSMIAQYESNAPYARKPKIETTLKIADALGISLVRLLSGQDESEKMFAPSTTPTVSEDESVFLDALNTYGMREQITMVFEEMSELQKELCKYLRGDDAVTITNIAEEIADVEIMLAQMKLFFKCSAEVADWRKRKIERLQRRLNGDV